MGTHADLEDLLRKTDYFASLEKTSLSLLADKMRLTKFQAGDIICREGERADWMFIVKSGEVAVLKGGEEVCEVEITSLRPGDLGGVMSLFDETPRTATLQARSAVELYTLEHAVFRRLVETNTELAMALLAYMSRTISRDSQVLAKLKSAGRDPRPAVAVFDSKPYVEEVFTARNSDRFALHFFDHRLTLDTVASAMGFRVVCVFVNDTVDADVVERLSYLGVEMIALRCAGYNNVDLEACARYGISVARVPAYSPSSVAEHALALIMSLNRRIHRAYARVREGNFALDGLIGLELHGKTAGVIGTGRIGKCLVKMLEGMGCRILAYDLTQEPELASRRGVAYVDIESLLRESDIISLHLPLCPETHHLIDAESIALMKRGVMLINTSRGGLIDTNALVEGLKTGQIGSAGLDVYEEESEYFFEDFSDSVITDDVLARLLTFNNVIVTGHQGFLTREALASIADTTMANIEELQQGKRGAELTNTVPFSAA